jgi:uncharacterized protein involved in type VI secretion and phage assembly
MSRVYGVVVGTVAEVGDPLGEGRVRVEFPWMEGNNRGFWAPVATLMSGDRRGSWFMPERGDEVLVAFDHGDVNHPYIIGFLWNGADKPPIEDGITESVRRIRTVSGHVIEFDDRPGQHRILIKTAGENQIEMKDLPLPSITIKTKGNQKVEMTDAPPAITASLATGTAVALDATGVSVRAMTGMVTINCLQASVAASAMLNVAAPITNFAGVVQVPTLIAGAVVSGAYNPAPGNIFGL